MRGAPVGWAVCYPAGTTEESNLPVVLALHGGFGNHLQVFEGMGFQRAQSAPGLLTDVAVASVDAGTSYYHRRSDGTDTGAMIVQDLLPALSDRGLDVARLGLSGCSMGGYGAVLLAATVLQGRVAAVAPISAALWPSLSAAPAFAFDGPDDFDEHDVFGMRAALGSVPVSVACGLSDPLLGYNQDFVSGFPTPPATSLHARRPRQRVLGGGGRDPADLPVPLPRRRRRLRVRPLAGQPAGADVHRSGGGRVIRCIASSDDWWRMTPMER